jgi:hypothetical protein
LQMSSVADPTRYDLSVALSLSRGQISLVLYLT